MIQRMYRPDELAKLEGCSRAEIYQRLAAGEYDARKDGRITLITSESVERRRAGLKKADYAPPRDNNRWHTLKKEAATA